MSDFEYDSGMDISSPQESADQFFDNADADDENFGFADVTPDKNKKKAYDVDFLVIEPREIVARQEKESGQIQGVLGLPTPAAAILLRQYKWKQDKLIDKYMEDPEGVLAKAGVTLDIGYSFFLFFFFVAFFLSFFSFFLKARRVSELKRSSHATFAA